MCLVKTSDTVADETARQEKIKERVDEWMSNMISQMKVSEHSSKGWPFFITFFFSGGLLQLSLEGEKLPQMAPFRRTL